jgi:hypothetical protein
MADKNSAGIWTVGKARFKVSCTFDATDDDGAARVAAERLVLLIVLLPAVEGARRGCGMKAETVEVVEAAATRAKAVASNCIVGDDGSGRPVVVKRR